MANSRIKIEIYKTTKSKTNTNPNGCGDENETNVATNQQAGNTQRRARSRAENNHGTRENSCEILQEIASSEMRDILLKLVTSKIVLK